MYKEYFVHRKPEGVMYSSHRVELCSATPTSQGVGYVALEIDEK